MNGLTWRNGPGHLSNRLLLIQEGGGGGRLPSDPLFLFFFFLHNEYTFHTSAFSGDTLLL